MFTRLTAAIRARLTRRRAHREADEELQFHLEHEIAANLARGMTADEARRVALRDLGGLTQTREAVREVRASWGEDTVADVRAAWRHLIRDMRGHTLITVVTLAVGIGGAAAIFALADSVVWRRIPFPSADRLVEVWSEYPQPAHIGGSFRVGMGSREQVLAWREQRDLFDHVEAYQFVTLVYQGASQAHLVRGASVTPGLLRLAGLVPQHGRIFRNDEAVSGANRVAIVSYRFWDEHLGHTPDAVGRAIELDSVSYQVVGVAPRTFRFPDHAAQIWIPEPLAAPATGAGDPDRRVGPGALAAISMLVPVARLATSGGSSFEQIDAQVSARGAAVNQAAGATATGAALVPFGRQAGARARQVVALLAAGVAGLLLVIVVNASALMVSRALARRPVWALKAALGAERATLVREVVAEQVCVGLVICAGAAATTMVVLGALPTVMPGIVNDSLNPADLDGRTLAFLVVVTVAAIVMASVPVLAMVAAAGRHPLLRESGRRVSTSRGTRRAGRALIAIEVALSLTLVIGTALMGRSLLALHATDRGFRAEGLVALHVALPASGYTSVPARERFVSDALAVLGSLPGVEAVTSGAVPPGPAMKGLLGQIEVDAAGPAAGTFRSDLFEVRPGFFDVIGLPLLAGRSFTGDDPFDVVVINEAFATKFWPDIEAAVGGRFRTSDSRPWRTVIGVVRNVRSQAADAQPAGPQAYFRSGIEYPDIAVGITGASMLADERTIVARLSGVGATARDLAAAVTSLDRTVVVRDVESVGDMVRLESAQTRFVFTLVATFGTLALLVSTMGLYGLLAQEVARQRREIGVRLALGASRGAIGRRIVGRGLLVTLMGLGAGLSLAVAAVDVIRSQLYSVSPFDVPSVVAACGALVIAALIASVWPAVRAMRVEPAELLRSE